MTFKEIRQLHPGDQVQFNDPQPEYGSRIITIASISIQGDGEEDCEDHEDTIIYISGKDGSELECFAHELE